MNELTMSMDYRGHTAPMYGQYRQRTMRHPNRLTIKL